MEDARGFSGSSAHRSAATALLLVGSEQGCQRGALVCDVASAVRPGAVSLRHTRGGAQTRPGASTWPITVRCGAGRARAKRHISPGERWCRHGRACLWDPAADTDSVVDAPATSGQARSPRPGSLGWLSLTSGSALQTILPLEGRKRPHLAVPSQCPFLKLEDPDVSQQP